VKQVVKAPTAPPSAKLPITLTQLTAIARATLYSLLSVRNTFILILMFVGLMRESEAMALGEDDVWEEVVGSATILFIFIEKSKTDRGRAGYTVVLEASPVSPVCPVICGSARTAL
jgi:hypothetical protein